MVAPASTLAAFHPRRLLHASELYHEAKHSFAKMGLIADPKFDLGKMMGFKQEAIDGNTKGIDFLFKKNKVTVIRGEGKIVWLFPRWKSREQLTRQGTS